MLFPRNKQQQTVEVLSEENIIQLIFCPLKIEIPRDLVRSRS